MAFPVCATVPVTVMLVGVLTLLAVLPAQAQDDVPRPALLNGAIPGMRHLPALPPMPSVSSMLPSWGEGSKADTVPPGADGNNRPTATLPGFGDLPLNDPTHAASAATDTRSGSWSEGPVDDGRLDALRSGSLSADGRQRVADFRRETAVFFPGRTIHDSIQVSAKTGSMRKLQNSDLYFLEGDCSIRQGEDLAQAPAAVVWIDHPDPTRRAPRRVLIYLESDDPHAPVEVRFGRGGNATRIRDWSWNGELLTTATVDRFIPNIKPSPTDFPDVYGRALDSLGPKKGAVVQAQYLAATPASSGPGLSGMGGIRKIGLYSRSDLKTDIQGGKDVNNTGRSVYVITNGINLTIEGANHLSPMLEGRVQDISADHAVIWAGNLDSLRSGEQNVQNEEDDFEVFLAGNIVFRDGPRTIFADRLYYDVKNKLAYIVDGEVLAPIPNMRGSGMAISGIARMKAQILRQQGDGMFEAENATITTSLLGKPTYRLRAKTMTLNEMSAPLTTLAGEPRIDPNTGKPATDDKLWLVSENNFIEFGDVPVFYWPWMAADVRDPILYIKSIGYGNDEIFGNQYRTAWNPYQILGIRNRPAGTSWDLNLDYYDKRGFGHGTDFSYDRSDCFGLPGRTRGIFSFWGIQDSGLDRLSGRRNNIPFPESYRYRLNFTHREELGTSPDPWVLTARIGKTSDRNFMEQYYTDTWFSSENETTSVELRKAEANRALAVSAEYQLDYFVTNTNTLPRLDYYILGQSLLKDLLTWHSHTRLEYAQYRVLDAPTTAQDLRYFRYLPQEVADAGFLNPVNPNTEPLFVEGEVFSTRHELDLPFSLGPVRCVPYVLGDFSHWGKDRTGRSLQRWYGQAGARFNLPLWKVYPNVSSRAFYVNGLAHKVDFDAEYLYASSDQPLDRLIIYDPLDDWSTDAARRTFDTTSYARLDRTAHPTLYDARYYALRSAFAGNVTASSMEIADSLTLLRVGMTHRWQTKRGSDRKRNIIDWITFSTHFNFYPEAERDNYGESIGLIDYNFKWFVGDRVSLFSSGLFDTMNDGQSMVSLGGRITRPGRGGISVVADWLDGPIQYTYLTMNLAYEMNEKYSMRYSTSYDLAHNRNVGHHFSFVRTGESFRVMVGAVYNESLENWSLSFGLEPVFLSGLANLTNRVATQSGRN